VVETTARCLLAARSERVADVDAWACDGGSINRDIAAAGPVYYILTHYIYFGDSETDAVLPPLNGNRSTSYEARQCTHACLRLAWETRQADERPTDTIPLTFISVVSLLRAAICREARKRDKRNGIRRKKDNTSKCSHAHPHASWRHGSGNMFVPVSPGVRGYSLHGEVLTRYWSSAPASFYTRTRPHPCCALALCQVWQTSVVTTRPQLEQEQPH
jgi:hypothetical protein